MSLLAGADFRGVAAHPTEPLLATSSMTESGEGEGQIVVWDSRSGDALSATFDEHGFGFEPAEDMLRWAPTGRRIAAAAGTNAVMVVEDGRVLMEALPDETRDHVVDFCWMGNAEVLYAAALGNDARHGAGALMHAAIADGALRHLGKEVAPAILGRLVFHDAICAVVGDDFHSVFAIDATQGKLLYERPLAAFLPRPTISSKAAWSSNGHDFAIAAGPNERGDDRRSAGAASETQISLLDGASGRLRKTLTLPGEVDALVWGPAGANGASPLAVVTQPRHRDPRLVHLVVGDQVTVRLDLELAVASYALPDAKTAAFSHDGRIVALMLRNGSVSLVEVDSGKTTKTFSVKAHPKATPPEGLLWTAGGQLVALHLRGLSFWTGDGELIRRVGETT